MTEPRRLDATSLRALAHPLRLRLLDLLRLEGPSNSTQLAARVGESTGTVSWHLRQLAQHGFLTEDPGHGSKRERWWRAQQRAGVLADDGGLADQIETLLSWSFARASRFLHADLPDEWRSVALLAEWTQLRLTPDQLAALNQELRDVVERHVDAAAPGPDVRPVAVQLQTFPIAPEESP